MVVFVLVVFILFVLLLIVLFVVVVSYSEKKDATLALGADLCFPGRLKIIDVF